MMKALPLASIMTCVMALVSLAGFVGHPAAAPTQGAPRHILANTIPTRFGAWRQLPAATMAVVNPQTEQLLNRLYSQILTRSYMHSSGYVVMLSVAYGNDQRGALQAHKPEVCYPAQGFALHSSEAVQLSTPFGHIDARQLRTSLGPRKEPVTYWFTMGDTAVRGKLQQRLIELRYGLTGEIPDGLLFRVSSIDAEAARAFAQQQQFVNDLLSSLPTAERQWLGGLAH